MLFSPRARPDNKNYCKLSTDIDLVKDGVNLVGPFDFSSPIGTAKSSSLIPRTVWDSLGEKYLEFGILPPALSNERKSIYMNVSTMRPRPRKTNAVDLRSDESSLKYSMDASLMDKITTIVQT